MGPQDRGPQGRIRPKGTCRSTSSEDDEVEAKNHRPGHRLGRKPSMSMNHTCQFIGVGGGVYEAVGGCLGQRVWANQEGVLKRQKTGGTSKTNLPH